MHFKVFMKNSAIKILSMILISLFSCTGFASEIQEGDSTVDYWKVATIGTACIGGYCAYTLWQENQELKKELKGQFKDCQNLRSILEEHRRKKDQLAIDLRHSNFYLNQYNELLRQDNEKFTKENCFLKTQMKQLSDEYQDMSDHDSDSFYRCIPQAIE